MTVPNTNDTANLISHLRRLLPLAAHGRRGLMERLKGEQPEITSRSRVYVTNVYDGGEAGLIYAIKLNRDLRAEFVLLVAIDQIAFDGRHSISKAIALYRRRSSKRG